jgi:DNA-binding transcriptional MerR regulator
MSYQEVKGNYFTAGELANLFKISKQTLLYYDKIKLLSPAYVDEKGYRHYSIQQYLDLEIIVNLRSFNISIVVIKEYLKQRSKVDFLKLVSLKKQECEAIIKENEAIMKSLDVISKTAENKISFPFNKPLINYYDERLMKVTSVADEDDGKERIILFTKHSQTAFHNKKSLEKHVGWVISQDDFFVDKGYHPTKAFFSFIPNTQGHRTISRHILPAGEYLEIYFQGTYYKNRSQLLESVNSFLKQHDLEVAGDVYILTIENHLYYDNTSEYINKIFFQVKTK